MVDVTGATMWPVAHEGANAEIGAGAPSSGRIRLSSNWVFSEVWSDEVGGDLERLTEMGNRVVADDFCTAAVLMGPPHAGTGLDAA